jgi:hypothetical protein
MEEWIIDVETIYRTLKENATHMGVDELVTQRAQKIQTDMKDGEYIIPWEDAYQMAWNDLMEERKW